MGNSFAWVVSALSILAFILVPVRHFYKTLSDFQIFARDLDAIKIGLDAHKRDTEKHLNVGAIRAELDFHKEMIYSLDKKIDEAKISQARIFELLDDLRTRMPQGG